MTELPALIVVSPHYDDAVLSTWGLMAASSTTVVVNVFTGIPDVPVSSEWDRRCGFVDSDDAHRLRYEEDEHALAGRVDRRIGADLLDEAYLDRPRSVDDETTLMACLDDVLRDLPPDTVIAAPAGAGRRGRPTFIAAVRSRVPIRGLRGWRQVAPHPDHEWVRDTLLRFARDRRRPILLFDDVPNAYAESADDAVVVAASRFGFGAAAMFTVRIDRAAKVAALRAYPSQLRWLFPAWAMRRLEVTIPGTERCWLLVPTPVDGEDPTDQMSPGVEHTTIRLMVANPSIRASTPRPPSMAVSRKRRSSPS